MLLLTKLFVEQANWGKHANLHTHIHARVRAHTHTHTHTQYICPDVFPAAYPELVQTPTHRQAIVNAFVFVHQTLHQANSRLSKRGSSTMALTPRHYLDFINHYVSVLVLCVECAWLL